MKGETHYRWHLNTSTFFQLDIKTPKPLTCQGFWCFWAYLIYSVFTKSIFLSNLLLLNYKLQLGVILAKCFFKKWFDNFMALWLREALQNSFAQTSIHQICRTLEINTL